MEQSDRADHVTDPLPLIRSWGHCKYTALEVGYSYTRVCTKKKCDMDIYYH